jgi:rubrerythrin
MDADAVFRQLADMERSLAELYGSWAKVFGSDREATFVFYKMSVDEKGHANLVDFQRRFAQKNPKLVREVDVDLVEIRRTTTRARAFMKENPSPSLEVAVALALDFENSAAEAHFRNALKQANPEMERLLGCLGGEDRQHATRLTEFAEKRKLAQKKG